MTPGVTLRRFGVTLRRRQRPRCHPNFPHHDKEIPLRVTPGTLHWVPILVGVNLPRRTMRDTTKSPPPPPTIPSRAMRKASVSAGALVDELTAAGVRLSLAGKPPLPDRSGREHRPLS